jgi:hypothetical protein
MEHERGAFKVKLPNRPTQLRNGWKFTGSISRTAVGVSRTAVGALRKRKNRARILVKSHLLHKK